MLAALYVSDTGPYIGRENIDPWTETRDARKYAGPNPVIAHPPCQRWGSYYAGSPYVIAKTGFRHKLGDDDGCFEKALSSVREYGGVLEHPAKSKAFTTYNLPLPDKENQWTIADEYGGKSVYLEQGNYGHRIRKPTWLYAVTNLYPFIKRGTKPLNIPEAAIIKVGAKEAYRRGELAYCPKPERIHSPEEFIQLLEKIASNA